MSWDPLIFTLDIIVFIYFGFGILSLTEKIFIKNENFLLQDSKAAQLEILKDFLLQLKRRKQQVCYFDTSLTFSTASFFEENLNEKI